MTFNNLISSHYKTGRYRAQLLLQVTGIEAYSIVVRPVIAIGV